MNKSKIEQLPLGIIAISPNVKKPKVYHVIERSTGRRVLTTNRYEKANNISLKLMEENHKIYFVKEEQC